MVSAWGMTPETAADGNEALEKLTDFPADVILTDLNMPGLDGFGFLQRLRDSGDMPPTIVLTAYGNVETAVRDGARTWAPTGSWKNRSSRAASKC